ncbi:DSBA family oxidoreductase [Coccidioides posadasii str. Silveira]|uniref:Glutathione S-transferase kappa n=2 Tax=Coccidioides posadasii TaxID=199306 RepID=E9CXT6_COCPS|nr:DSBA family oxidoreductase [Coccidioides posadasii str. Silveira]
MNQKKIECYIDCVSPFSFFALSYLRQNRKALADSDVSVEFIPVFLGGINVGSGNKPPWTLPAKALYAKYDGPRAQKYFGKSFKIPPFFPILSLLPQRCLVYAKKQYPEKHEDFFESCFETMWNGQLDISKPENLLIAARKVFDEAQAQEILKGGNDPEIKKTLADNTEHAVKTLGAFGCPWFWVHDGKGNAEPFFGSDRFHFMWDYLDIPHRDLELMSAPAKL